MTTPELPTSKLFPLHFRRYQRCCDCFGWKPASVLQIITGANWNRHRYYCINCATRRELPQSKGLLEADKLAQLEKARATVYQQNQSQDSQRRKAKAGGRRK